MITEADLAHYTAIIVGGFCSGNPVRTDQIPELIRQVRNQLRYADGELVEVSTPRGKSLRLDPESAEAYRDEFHKPAVPIEKSIQPDYLVCLEDGKQLKILKRYLMAQYQMTPEDYRIRWGLPPDYPMVAPNYSERRKQLAIDIKLGHRRRK
jgi:predicted transcriptional regulator